MLKKGGLLLLSVVFLLGCATSYQSEGFTGGFSETPIREDVWQVNFSGNAYTSSQAVEQYALYRAAELTQREGYDYFEIVESKNFSSTFEYKTAETTTETLTGERTTGGHTIEMDKPGTTLLIKMNSGELPRENPHAVDPEFILNNYDVE